jgi:hypothetical protein
VRQLVAGKDVNMEAEESTLWEPLLGNIVKCAIVNCRVCELAIPLQLIVVTISKSPINLITNPNPMSSH